MPDTGDVAPLQNGLGNAAVDLAKEVYLTAGSPAQQYYH